MLDSGRTEIVANAAQGIRPGVAIFAGNPYLDQFMGVEVAIDFLEYRSVKPAIANQYHGIECMGAGLECAAFAGGHLICQDILLKTKL